MSIKHLAKFSQGDPVPGVIIYNKTVGSSVTTFGNSPNAIFLYEDWLKST